MSSLLNKVKSWGWVKTLGLVLGGILLALAAGRAASKKAAADRKDQRAADLLNSQISNEIQKGKKLVESAQKDKDKAVELHQASQKRLEQMAENNEDMDSIADRFNSKRVRRSG